MRKLLTIVALAATIIMAGNAVTKAQDMWWDPAWGGSYPVNAGKFGVDQGRVLFDGKDQLIQQLYLGGKPSTVNSSGTIKVDSLYVDANTIANGAAFTGSGATIGDFVLQVGQETFSGKTFGTAEAAEITMSADAINGVGNTFGTWTVNNRKVVNNGAITKLNYDGGTYEGDGSLGTVVAGTALNGLGKAHATNLSFKADNGYFTIDATADANSIASYMGDYMGEFTADNIDYTGARIALNLDGFDAVTDFESAFDAWIGENGQFSFDFASGGAAATTGVEALADFGFNWGNGEFFSIFDAEHNILTNWLAEGGVIAYDAPTQAPTPEPATLAVLGLGLAGLGMASRRRRK